MPEWLMDSRALRCSPFFQRIPRQQIVYLHDGWHQLVVERALTVSRLRTAPTQNLSGNFDGRSTNTSPHSSGEQYPELEEEMAGPGAVTFHTPLSKPTPATNQYRIAPDAQRDRFSR